MILIKEENRQNETYFKMETYNQKNKLIDAKIIYLKSAIIEHENKHPYFIIYNQDMIPMADIFRFINFKLASKAVNTREKSLYALKLLYVFKEVINKDFEDFTKTDILNLYGFLRGYSLDGQVTSFKLKTLRNSETIKGYMSVYRNYIRYLNIKNSCFLRKSEKEVNISVDDSDEDLKIYPYESSEKSLSMYKEVPKYISVEEFSNIVLNIVRKKYSKREECIIRLMYQCGLRIGEVLGLTADDVVIRKIEDKYVAVAYIRNRLSDRKDQKAKTCMQIFSKVQYKSSDYKTKNKGFQRVIVPMDLYDLINEYIEEVHVSARENKHNNYYKYTIADRVGKANKFDDDNYYIFINSQGKPLSAHLWNYTLRDIFMKANIPIDEDVKKTNLNHKFRHGFAMYQVKYRKVGILELQKLLRHGSTKSVHRYYQPTLDDEIELKTEFDNGLYTIIPQLNLSRKDAV